MEQTQTIVKGSHPRIQEVHVSACRMSTDRPEIVRFNNLDHPRKIPLETTYAFVTQSDVPIVVQHTRLDSRQAEDALLFTIAFGAD